jgi:hypothetical protein
LDADGDNQYELTIRVEDAAGNGTDRDVIVTVTNIVEPVSTDDDAYTIGIGDATALNIFNNDAFNGAGPYTITLTSPSNGTLVQRPGDVVYSHDSNAGYGPDSFSYTVESADGVTSTSTVTINIYDGDVPVFTKTEFLTVENTIQSFQIPVTASDTNDFEFAIVGGPDASLFDLDTDTGMFSFNAIKNYENAEDANGDNVYELLVSAEAPTGTTTTELIRLTVGNQVETPTAVDDSFSIDEGALGRFRVLNNDSVSPNDNIVALDIISSENGSARFNVNNRLVFTHDGSETTTGSVVYQITNEEGNSAIATVAFNVIPVDDLADANNDNFSIDSSEPSTFTYETLRANDVDVDSDTSAWFLDIVNGPSHGSVQIVDNDVVYTPDSEYAGLDQFTYQLIDGSGAIRSDVAAVLLTVTPGDLVGIGTNTEDTTTSSTVDPPVNDKSDTGPEVGTGLNRPSDNDDNDDESDQSGLGNRSQHADHAVSNLAFNEYVNSELDIADFGMSLENLANSYAYTGRTQFIELSSNALSDTVIRVTTEGVADFASNISLGMLARGAGQNQAFVGEGTLPLGYEEIIVTTGTFFSVGAMTWAVRAGLAF